MALPTSHNVVTAAQLGSTLSSYNTKLNARFKPKQTAVSDPTASDTTITAIATISQDADGVITATKKTIRSASTSATGIVQLSSATNSTSTSLAATASAVKAAYDLANGKQSPITFDGTYDASTNKAATVSTVTTAIAALDGTVSGTPSSAKTLTAFSQTDGKVSATFSNIAIAESQVTNLTTDLAAKAPLASPTFTGTPKAPTAAAGTNTTQIATTEFVNTAVTNGLATADALVYKGTISGSTESAAYGGLTVAANKGDVYKVSVAGKVDGVAVEVGDMIICNTDSTAAATSSNYSTIAANWDFIQGNTEGVVIGPASAVDTRVAVFDGTTGKLIKDSGYTIAKSVPSNAVFTDTNTKVTSADNHYAPSTVSGQDKSASASGATAAWSIDVVKGVTLNTDGKGHVTGISVTSGKIPGNPNTDTKVKATEKTDDANYKILATASASPTSGGATEAVYSAGITLNPSTNTIAANISGNAATATSATTASNYATGGTIESALNGKAASGHTHDIALATDSGTATVTLAHNTTYKLTAGGKSVIFKTPVDNNSDTKVTQTLVASDNTSEYPILLAPTGQTATTTTTSNFVTGAKYKPSTNTLSVNVSGSSASCSGNAATASAAQSGSALETAINGKAASSHSHGNVTSSGTITAAAVDIATGDALTIVDSSASGKLAKSSLTFDGSTTTKCLTQKGVWASFSTLAIGTTSSTAAAGNHTHTTSMATSTGTSSITLEVGTKYSLSAGGTSYIFQNGTEMTDQEVTDLLDALT